MKKIKNQQQQPTKITMFTTRTLCCWDIYNIYYYKSFTLLFYMFENNIFIHSFIYLVTWECTLLFELWIRKIWRAVRVVRFFKYIWRKGVIRFLSVFGVFFNFWKISSLIFPDFFIQDFLKISFLQFSLSYIYPNRNGTSY